MDIVRSLELESFILTKFTKPSVHVNLVGPQVSLPYGGSQLAGGIHFLCVIRKHFLACEDIAGWSELTAGGMFFSRNTVARPVGLAVRWRNNYFARNKEALPCCSRGPSCQRLHAQYSFDGSQSLTTPRREHQGGGRQRGLGRGRHGAGEDATVEACAERSMRVHWFDCGVSSHCRLFPDSVSFPS